MIEFRQKAYGLLGLTAMIAPGMIQSHNQNKKNTELQEDFQRQNAKLQEKQTEAMNKIAKAAEKDPSKVQAAQSIMQQKAYAAPANFLQKGGKVVYEFAKGLGTNKNIGRVVGGGLAFGASMAAGGYAVDKAIQADRKRITGGAPLPVLQKSDEEKAASRKKKLKKLAVGTTLAAGSILAARHGAFGEGLKNLSHLKNSAGNPIKLKGAWESTKHHFKKGIGIEKVKPTKEAIAAAQAKGVELKARTRFNPKNVILGAGFGGLLSLPYVMGERQQLKEQYANQQKQYSDEEPQQPRRRASSVLKKAAIGTAATIGTVATLRRVGPVGLRKGLNDMYMTYGKKLAGKSGTGKLGNWMMSSGSKQYGKAVVQGRQRSINKMIKAGEKAEAGGGFLDRHNVSIFGKRLGRTKEELQKVAEKGKRAARSKGLTLDASQISAARLEKIKNGTASRKLGEGVLGGISSIFGMGKRKTGSFLNKMANTNAKSGVVYSQETQNVANFLKKHHRIALVGATGLGLASFKPYEWGDAAVKRGLGAVDKNAFAYEKSKEQPVPNE